jgi:hypothetical protein
MKLKEEMSEEEFKKILKKRIPEAIFRGYDTYYYMINYKYHDINIGSDDEEGYEYFYVSDVWPRDNISKKIWNEVDDKINSQTPEEMAEISKKIKEKAKKFPNKKLKLKEWLEQNA